MRGVKKRQRREVEFMDELRYLVGDSADNPDLFIDRWNLAQHFDLHWSDMRSQPRSIVRNLVLVKAGIPQNLWVQEKPAPPTPVCDGCGETQENCGLACGARLAGGWYR